MSSTHTPYSARVFAAVTLCMQGVGSQACGGIAIDRADEETTDREHPNDRVDQNEPDKLCTAAECPPDDSEPPLITPPTDGPPPNLPPPNLPPPNLPPPIDIPPPDDGPVESPPAAVCDGPETLFVEGLDLPTVPEFLGVVQVTEEEASFTQAKGTCLGSSDIAGCVEKLERDLLADTTPLFGQYYLVAVSFDLVTIINNVESLLHFIGPVNTATETELVLRAHGYNESNVGPRFICGGFSTYRENCLILADNFPYIQATSCDSAEGTRSLLCVSPEGELFREDERYTVYGQCLGGRRPAGLAPFAPFTTLARASNGDQHAPNSRGAADFVHLYLLESAAVVAFSHLARELEERGAPLELIQRARDAAQDEVRHARLARERAYQAGAQEPLPEIEVEEHKPRSLLDMALENAEEGYVRESFGAAQALLRAKWTTHPADQIFWSEIAVDELRHAELSRDLGEWLRSRLTEKQNKRVNQARARAYKNLHRELSQAASHPSTRNDRPSAQLELTLLEHLQGDLAPLA